MLSSAALYSSLHFAHCHNWVEGMSGRFGTLESWLMSFFARCVIGSPFRRFWKEVAILFWGQEDSRALPALPCVKSFLRPSTPPPATDTAPLSLPPMLSFPRLHMWSRALFPCVYALQVLAAGMYLRIFGVDLLVRLSALALLRLFCQCTLNSVKRVQGVADVCRWPFFWPSICSR